MAMINHRSVTLSRVMAAALNAHDLVFPGSNDPRTRKDYIYEIVKIHLAHLIFLPVDEDNARTLTLALAHGIRPVLQRHCIGDAPWEGFERMTAIEWLCYGIRHEEVELVRWLVEKVWPKLGSDVTVAGGQTLLDFARYGRFEKPRNKHAQEEIIQLVADNDPKPLLKEFPGVRRESLKRLEEM